MSHAVRLYSERTMNANRVQGCEESMGCLHTPRLLEYMPVLNDQNQVSKANILTTFRYFTSYIVLNYI